MKLKKILGALVFATLLASCDPKVSSSAPLPSGSSGVEREQVYDPGISFTTMDYQNNHAFWAGIDFTLEGEVLRQALYDKMWASFVGVNYSTAIPAINEMDQDPRDATKVLSLYDLYPHAKTAFGTTWNREHTFPQSKLADNDDSLRAQSNIVNISSDIANLFACDWDLNEQRSNNSYGEWDYASDPDGFYPYLTRNKQGMLTDSVLRRGYFSPTPLVKGEVARAQMYMLVMYPERCSISENFSIATMIQWERDYPPTIERDGQRQAGIAKYQKIRNPFIDIENLSCKIWGNFDNRTKAACGI